MRSVCIWVYWTWELECAARPLRRTTTGLYGKLRTLNAKMTVNTTSIEQFSHIPHQSFVSGSIWPTSRPCLDQSQRLRHFCWSSTCGHHAVRLSAGTGRYYAHPIHPDPLQQHCKIDAVRTVMHHNRRLRARQSSASTSSMIYIGCKPPYGYVQQSPLNVDSH